MRRRIIEACEASLTRLQMEAIDLYQLHAIPHEWAMPVVMDTLAQLKTDGQGALVWDFDQQPCGN